jgi:hypothetical protein
MLTRRLLGTAAGLFCLILSAPAAAWWNAGWNYRVPVNVPAGAAVNSTIKVDVDFAALLTAVGAAGMFDPNSWRVVRADDATLVTTQEWTDAVYAGATDAAGNARGELRFILQDTGPTTYYLYFDVSASGPKAANPQTPINGNFEVGGAGTQSPPGWTATKADNRFDAQVRPSETPAITTDSGTPLTQTTDGTPFTGAFSYLLGARTNVEPTNATNAVVLSRTIAVPATNPGNLVFRYRPEGWDSSDNGATQWDFLRVQLVAGTTTEIVGPTFGGYVTFPFSPNKGTGQISNTSSGYGRYNYWDMDARGTHHAGMTLAAGSEPWFTRTYSLAAYAGQTITLRFIANHSVQYKSWTHIDDVEWSVVAATLGTPATNVVTPGGFNAYDTTTAAGAISGYIKTKIAAQTFNLDIIALNTARNAILAAFTGAVKVELLDASNNTGALDANGCRSTWATIQTLAVNPTFAAADSGRMTVSFQEDNAWKDVRVRVSYPASGTPTAIGCSNDNFAIRPASFASASVTDTTWTTAGNTRTLDNMAASGGVVHKAGQPVRVSAVAVNSLGNVTTNYVDRPAATPIACVLPTGCVNGNLGVFTLATNAVAGVLVDNAASYSEAGSFTLQLVDANFAAVDAGDGSTTTDRYVVSSVFNVGRFVPDHFDLAASNTPQLKTFNDATCASRSFTYIGQPFGYVTAPQALVMAKNAAGGTTLNYANNLWKLTATDVTQTYASVPAAPALTTTLGAPTVLPNNDGTGYITVNSSDTLTYTRSAGAPYPAPFNANITLAVGVQDSTENGPSQGIITTSTPATFNGGGAGIAFDAGNAFRYGRVGLANAYGSERLPLQVPVRADYFNGATFVTNSADNCTRFTLATDLALGNYQRNLNPGETTPSPAAITLAAGVSAITLSAPGVGNSGSVDLTLSVPNWLQFNWSGAVGNPKARATFGVFRNVNEFIYLREAY